MRKVNLIIMLGVFLTCTSTAKASYEDEMELRTMSKIELRNLVTVLERLKQK